jgi:type III secretory pathway component EscR
MKKFTSTITFLSLLLLGVFVMQGCGNTADSKASSTALSVEKVSSDTLSNDSTEKMDEVGAYLIQGDNEEFVAFVEKGYKITDVNAEVEGNNVIIHYYTEADENTVMSVYEDAFRIKNTENIDTVTVYLNDEESSFVEVM